MPLIPRLARDHIQAVPRNNELLLLINAQLAMLERHEANARRYLLKDPSLLHCTPLWSALVEDYLWLNGFLQTWPNPALSARVRRKVPDHFQQRLILLAQQQQTLIAAELAELYTDPLCYYYRTQADALPEAWQAPAKALATQFTTLAQGSITQLAESIRAISAHLFVSLTPDEMLNTDSTQCPHFLEITRFTKLLNFTLHQNILQQADTNARCYLLYYWIQVTQQLVTLGDYASAKQLQAAFDSDALFRLENSKAGLSVAMRHELHQLQQTLGSAKWITQQIAAHAHGIPYMGTYRFKLEQAKVAKNVADAQTKLQRQQNFLVELQQKIRSGIDLTVAMTKPLAAFMFNQMSQSADATQNVDFFSISLQLEPRNNANPASQLFKEQPNNHLGELPNPNLIRITLTQQQVFPKMMATASAATNDTNQADSSLNQFLQPTDFEALRKSTTYKQSVTRFGSLLKACHLQFNDDTVEALHRHTRQQYYRNQIENTALRRFAGNTVISKKITGLSTTDTLHDINALLAAEASQTVIDTKLQRLNIHLSVSEWREVRQCALQQRQQHRIPDIEKLLKSLEYQLNQLQPRRFTSPTVKSQLDDYLYLLANIEKLDKEDKITLSTELSSVVNDTGYCARGHNPFLVQIEKLQQTQAYLLTLVNHLSTQNKYHQKLARLTAEYSQKLTSRYFQHLVQGSTYVKTWGERQGQVSPDFYDALRSLLFKQPLVLNSVFGWYFFLARTLRRVQYRSQQSLMTQSFSKITLLLNSQLLPVMTTLLKKPPIPSEAEWEISLDALLKAHGHFRSINEEATRHLRSALQTSAPELFRLAETLVLTYQELADQRELYKRINKALEDLGALYFNYDVQLKQLRLDDYLSVANSLVALADTQALPKTNLGAWDEKVFKQLRKYCKLIRKLVTAEDDLRKQQNSTQLTQPSPSRALSYLTRLSPFISAAKLAHALSPNSKRSALVSGSSSTSS